MSDIPSPTPDWLHALWAAVVALFWKLDATKTARVKVLEEKVDNMATQVTTHSALHSSTKEAILDLRIALKENTEETRKVAETLIRIETLVTQGITQKGQ